MSAEQEQRDFIAAVDRLEHGDLVYVEFEPRCYRRAKVLFELPGIVSFLMDAGQSLCEAPVDVPIFHAVIVEGKIERYIVARSETR